MAKKRQRTDTERRARQCERLSRLLRVLRCIMGPGRWDAESLARELEVSPRTVHRIMQVLSMSGVPWYYCKESGCYRVRPGFKFPGLDIPEVPSIAPNDAKSGLLLKVAQRLIAETTCFNDTLREICTLLEAQSGTGGS